MKKRIICLAVLALVCASLFACSAPHVHTYEYGWSHDMYEHWHAAACEHTEEERDRAAHFFEGSVKVRETCTTPGVHTLTCAECGFATDIDVPAAHRYENGVCAECGEAQA